MAAPIGDPLPEGDLYLLQGAEDEDQPVVAHRLAEEGTLARAAAAGKVVVGIGAGYQILGTELRHARRRQDGGPRPARRAHDARRARGQPRRHEASPGSGCLRSSATSGTGAARRSARRRSRSPRSRSACATAATHLPTAPCRATSSGTYLHGPLLPRNPELADLLLGWALGVSSSRCRASSPSGPARSG